MIASLCNQACQTSVVVDPSSLIAGYRRPAEKNRDKL